MQERVMLVISTMMPRRCLIAIAIALAAQVAPAPSMSHAQPAPAASAVSPFAGRFIAGEADKLVTLEFAVDSGGRVTGILRIATDSIRLEGVVKGREVTGRIEGEIAWRAAFDNDGKLVLSADGRELRLARVPKIELPAERGDLALAKGCFTYFTIVQGVTINKVVSFDGKGWARQGGFVDVRQEHKNQATQQTTTLDTAIAADPKAGQYVVTKDSVVVY